MGAYGGCTSLRIMSSLVEGLRFGFKGAEFGDEGIGLKMRGFGERFGNEDVGCRGESLEFIVKCPDYVVTDSGFLSRPSARSTGGVLACASCRAWIRV